MAWYLMVPLTRRSAWPATQPVGEMTVRVEFAPVVGRVPRSVAMAVGGVEVVVTVQTVARLRRVPLARVLAVPATMGFEWLERPTAFEVAPPGRSGKTRGLRVSVPEVYFQKRARDFPETVPFPVTWPKSLTRRVPVMVAVAVAVVAVTPLSTRGAARMSQRIQSVPEVARVRRATR